MNRPTKKKLSSGLDELRLLLDIANAYLERYDDLYIRDRGGNILVDGLGNPVVSSVLRPTRRRLQEILKRELR